MENEEEEEERVVGLPMNAAHLKIKKPSFGIVWSGIQTGKDLLTVAIINNKQSSCKNEGFGFSKYI